MLLADNIKKTYTKNIRALRGVSVQVAQGQTTGLVGESGCGKSTLARIMCRLEQPDAGSLGLNGKEYTRLHGRRLRELRKRVQIVFQDSSASLDPRRTIAQSLVEPLENYGKLSGAEKERQVNHLLDSVALSKTQAQKYPHQLSGGQRQRVVIARSLALEPEYVVCDEPVSSLDAEVQQPILALLKDLQRERGLGYLFISHDISLTMEMSNMISVMYAGNIVEEIPAAEIARHAAHPYTRLLFSKALERHCNCEKVALTSGHAQSGCPYHLQCPHKIDICETMPPRLEGETHRIACHNPASEGHYAESH